MSVARDNIIQFAGLSAGEHQFDFLIKDKFFETLDYSEIKQGNIIVDVSLLKQSTMLVLNFKISGTVRANCDRCTEEFDLPISGKYRLIVKIGGNEEEAKDDDIIFVAPSEHEIDLSQIIYEYIILSLPPRRLHSANKCDKEMLKKLKVFNSKEEKKETTDPRWNELKNIKLN